MLNFFQNKKIITTIKKKLKKKRKELNNFNFFFRAVIHVCRFIFFSSFRKNICLIDPPSNFFYKYRKFANFFSFPLVIFAKYLKKNNIFISVNNNCNYSMGHIYSEISELKRMQILESKYLDSTIWFTSSRKEILGQMKDIFEDKNFKILFGGIKRIFLTFVAIRCPIVSIDASLSNDNYINGDEKLSSTVVYNDKPLKRAKMMTLSPDFNPYNDKLDNYHNNKIELMKKLKISKKYIIIQIKTIKANGTLKPLSPDSLLKTIKYFQDKDYQIVFAGREEFPEVFRNKSVIDYANSKYASTLNDFILVGYCSFVIASASGFCLLPEILDKPMLTMNTVHGIQHYGRRTITLPTLLTRSSKPFNAIIQHEYLCKYGKYCGYDILDDLIIHHMPNSEEIFMAAKELEEMLLDKISPFTSLQQKIYDSNDCPLLSYGLSRISHYYLSKHEYFYIK